MKNPRISVRFKTVVAVSLLLFIPSTFAGTVDQGENTVPFSQSHEWNALIGGLDYLARHPELKIGTPDKTAGEGSATGVKETSIGDNSTNPFIARFKAGVLNSIAALYAHGYYTNFQARQLSYTIRNADITGDDATAVLEIIGKQGAAN